MASIHENATAAIERAIRVVLADDTGSVRRALRLVLSSEPDLRVIGEAADGEQAVRLARDLHPDIIVMDLELPGMNGLDATRRIKAAGEMCAIIMLTVWGGDAVRDAATCAGVAHFIEKGDHLDNLAETIRALHARNNPA
jgi:two-component system, NarL family, response regulator DesR